MAKDGYIPADGNAGDLAVGAESVAGGSGGAILGNFSTDNKSADALLLPADGNAHTLTALGLHFTAPPAWISAAGIIQQEGLYVVYAGLSIGAVFTAVQLVSIDHAFNVASIVASTDQIAFAGLGTLDIQSLAAGDVPYPIGGITAKCAVDITGNLNLQVGISRLAA